MSKIKQVWQVIEHYTKLEKMIQEYNQAIDALEDEGMNNSIVFSRLITQVNELRCEKDTFEKRYITWE